MILNITHIMDAMGKTVRITYPDGKMFVSKNGLTYVIDKETEHKILGAEIVKFEILD